MPILTRYQNPTPGDTVRLELFSLNSNNYADVNSITQIEIFYLDPTMMTPSNPDGRVLVQIIGGGSVVNPATGEYYIDLFLDPTVYTHTGRYVDEWSVMFETGSTATLIDQLFSVYPPLWFTTPTPIVYDFSFYFQPNRFRPGEKKYIIIELIPNVPTATDLADYYENLAISSSLKVSIAKRCGDCTPCSTDESLIVDEEDTQYREKNRAFYYLDTTDYDCGVYDVWFKLEFGGNTYISDKNQISIQI